MKKIIISLVFLFLFSSNIFALEKQLVDKSSVHILIYSEANPDQSRACSGVVINNQTAYATVLTAKHCVGQNVSYFVEEYPALVVTISEKEDLAFLYVPFNIKGKISATVAKQGLFLNQQVYLLGKLTLGDYWQKGRTFIPLLNFDIVILNSRQGCSGGGVWNEKGELVGILVAGLGKNESPISVIMNLKKVKVFLNEIGDWRGNVNY